MAETCEGPDGRIRCRWVGFIPTCAGCGKPLVIAKTTPARWKHG